MSRAWTQLQKFNSSIVQVLTNSKCDGEQPNCSTCTAVYKTPCRYDVDDDHRRKGALRRDIAALTEEKESLITIIEAIKSYSDTEVAEIIQHIRANESLVVVAETLGKHPALPDATRLSVHPDLPDQFRGQLAFEKGTFEGERIQAYGPTLDVDLISDRHSSSTQIKKMEDWTTVTRDKSLVRFLIQVYFCWVHPFYCFFSEDLFLNDMLDYRGAYCSSLLVNAVLAVASHYTDKVEARADPHDHDTIGDHFFEEAKRILNQDDAGNLTTVQALALMSLHEVSSGRINSGYQYSGRCMRMLVELGLHLSSGLDRSKLDQKDWEARKITFWACHSYDT